MNILVCWDESLDNISHLGTFGFAGQQWKGDAMEQRRNRATIFGERPLWRNYYVACVLIVGGFMTIDGAVAGPSPHNRVMEVVGATMFFAGIPVFAAALGSTVCSIFRKKPPGDGPV